MLQMAAQQPSSDISKISDINIKLKAIQLEVNSLSHLHQGIDFDDICTLLQKKQQQILAAINTATSEAVKVKQSSCQNHNYVYDWHDSHYSYHKCVHCGHTDKH
jgi:hypothetical protein